MFVPVKSKEGQQLMPTSPPVARHLIKSGKATPYWNHGVFCIRLNYEISDWTQEIAVGVDPGSKKEGFKGGNRPRYGGTVCEGLVKNTLVKHVKHGLTRISGFGKRGISLYDLEGKRLCQNAKISDFKVLTRLNFTYRSSFSPKSKDLDLHAED